MAKKGGSILLSPKFGVNPTILKCVICCEDTGEIALMGRVKETSKQGSITRAVRGSDIQMPMYSRGGLCKRCKDLLKAGNTGFVNKNTGDTAILKQEAVKRMFGGYPSADLKAESMKRKIVYVENTFWKQ
jgi:hypothetical protein